jgi:hypothetical protein
MKAGSGEALTHKRKIERRQKRKYNVEEEG